MPERARVDRPPSREACYDGLIAYASGQGNDDALARMLASRMCDEGALPVALGLSSGAFAELMAHHFPGYADANNTLQSDGGAIAARSDEVAELHSLMLSHRAGDSPSESWMASIVAVACLGSDHLWQDLGLWRRAELTQLMQRNFPALAEKNVQNMKWKKFLYKQLCIAEGVYVCRSPSCEVCADYQDCFGPEE